MLHALMERLVDRVIGPANRATSFARDDRHALPGWPSGIDMDRVHNGSGLKLAATLRDRAQHSLPLFWEKPATTPPSYARPKLRVIPGGRA